MIWFTALQIVSMLVDLVQLGHKSVLPLLKCGQFVEG